jgi:hypothetical protein
MSSSSYCWDIRGGSITDGCFNTQCFKDASNNDVVTLRVYIANNWVNCPLEGGDVSVTIGTIFTETITVICPDVKFFCSPIGSSAVNFTWDPTNNIPVPNAPPVPRLPPVFPDIPIPPGLPDLGNDFKKFLNDPWGLEVGSNLFWVLLALGVLLIIIFISCCCCNNK